MDASMQIEGVRRVALAVLILVCTGAFAWATMDAGKMRDGVLVILLGFALRIALVRRQ